MNPRLTEILAFWREDLTWFGRVVFVGAVLAAMGALGLLSVILFLGTRELLS